VVGRFGGPLMLPPDTPDPEHGFIASIDFAALPADSTDLPLPADGHLLLFIFVDDWDGCENAGGAIYVPAGTAVVERDKNAWNPYNIVDYAKVFELFPQGEMRVTTDVSLPYHYAVPLEGERESGPPPEHPRSQELVEVWEETFEDITTMAQLQLGGYASDEAVYTDPLHELVNALRHLVEEHDGDEHDEGEPFSLDSSDWVLLADWRPDIDGREGATAHWGIQRSDLVARRFDRTFTTIYWNP
jgi:hypothetical protein